MSDVTISVDDPEAEWGYVTADPEDLRERYARELREDGMYDADDDKLIEHVWRNNPDAPGLILS